MALSSFIHALYELETYAVARLVPKDGKSPVMVLLAPSISTDVECLYEVELPFAEDIRSYRFPALDKITTVSGKELKQHRFLPSDDLMDAMSSYVDAMDLSSFGTDEEGYVFWFCAEDRPQLTIGRNPSEYMPIEDTFSPALHRINHVIRTRAIYPDEELPPIQDILVKYSQPPQELVGGAKAFLDAITAAADVKKGQHPHSTHLYMVLTLGSAAKIQIEKAARRRTKTAVRVGCHCITQSQRAQHQNLSPERHTRVQTDPGQRRC